LAFAVLFYFGAEFRYHDNSIDNEDIFIAVFAIFFGAWAMGQAS